jgi:indolepyruvate ferredoxin oxidoreductase, beta subunit
MNITNDPTNIVLAGLGGQGVIRAANILAEAAFITGCDVKQSEIHGMSQRGGSVSSDVRFGKCVLSPMVPTGEADFLMVLHPTQVDNNLFQLKDGGVLISTRDLIGEGGDITVLDADDTPLTSRNFNVGLIGLLSSYLSIADEVWQEAVRRHLPKKVHEENLAALAYGKTLRKV